VPHQGHIVALREQPGEQVSAAVRGTVVDDDDVDPALSSDGPDAGGDGGDGRAGVADAQDDGGRGRRGGRRHN
jgi:hypothetical protein